MSIWGALTSDLKDFVQTVAEDTATATTMARDGSDDTRSQAGVAAGGAEQDADVGPKCEPFGLPLFGTSGAGVHDVLEGLDGISIGLADEAGSLGEVAEVGDEESHNARRRVRHDC